MDYPCYKCGHAVEEGTRFCPNCGAPQIRVQTIATPEQDPSPAPPPLTDAHVPQSPVPFAAEAWTPARQPLVWNPALRSAILSAVIAALLSTFLPFGFFLWTLAAGVFAGMTYRRRLPLASPTSGLGARLGALTGLFTFLLFAVAQAIVFVTARQQVLAELHRRVQQAISQQSDPTIQRQMEWLISPAGLSFLITLGAVLFFVLFLGCGTVGGALWGSFSSARERRA
jgi:hypothetical protein